MDRVQQNNGAWRLQFANGRTATCDPLVGADGNRSTVRHLLTDADVTELNRSDELWITEPDRNHLQIANLVGPRRLW